MMHNLVDNVSENRDDVAVAYRALSGEEYCGQ